MNSEAAKKLVMNNKTLISPLWLWIWISRSTDKRPNVITKDAHIALIAQEIPRVWGTLCQKGEQRPNIINFYNKSISQYPFLINEYHRWLQRITSRWSYFNRPPPPNPISFYQVFLQPWISPSPRYCCLFCLTQGICLASRLNHGRQHLWEFPSHSLTTCSSLVVIWQSCQISV